MGDTFRKFISIVCVLALLTGLVPSAALAAPDGTEAARAAEPVSVTADQKSGEPAADRSGSFSPKTSEVVGERSAAWQALQTAIYGAADGDTITLDGDVTAGSGDGPLVIQTNRSLTIDLNGHTIDRNMQEAANAGYVLYLLGNSDYTVTIKGSGTITGGNSNRDGGGIYVDGMNLSLEGSVLVTGNTAEVDGGGIYMSGSGTLYLRGDSSVTGNTAKGDGGGVYVDGTFFEMHGNSSITGNEAGDEGGGVYAHNGEHRLKGGTISGNTAEINSGNGICLHRDALLRLYEDNAVVVRDSIYLPEDKTIKVDSTLASGTTVNITLGKLPTADKPVVIAKSNEDYTSKFVITNQPDDTELVWENDQIILRYTSTEITTWDELQAALNKGGLPMSDGTGLIKLTQNITAGDSDTALSFAYRGHDVILDLNGYTLKRGMNALSPVEYGNVLTVSGGSLILRDSSAAQNGKITNGQNSLRGGGIVVSGGALTMESGSITGNTGSTDGGGVYVSGGSFTMSGGSITGNTSGYGGGISVRGGSVTLSGGLISDNTVHNGIYLVDNGTLTLTGGSTLNVADIIYLPTGKFITVTGTLTVNSPIRIQLEAEVTPGHPVKIAESEYDCIANLVIENQPENTELVWENGEILLRDKSDITTWAELQQALNNGGTWVGEEPEDYYIIRLSNNVTATGTDSALTFSYVGHDVTLDLNGHTINRNLSAAAAADNGNVLTVESGVLILSDSVGGGSITGGNNTASGGGVVVNGGKLFADVGITGNKSQDDGGGVYVNGGSFTLEGGSVTDNTAKYDGGGIAVDSGSVTLLSGNINNNTAQNNSKGINLSGNGALTLSGSSASIVTDNIYLPRNKTITVNGSPAAGSDIQVWSQGMPFIGDPVTIADAAQEWTEYFAVSNKPENAELIWTENKIILQTKPEVTSWGDLQKALTAGGTLERQGTEDYYIVRLANDVAPGDDESALMFDYTGHDVILDLNGHTIDRNLAGQESEYDSVLNVQGSNLILRDSGNGGKITGGFAVSNGVVNIREGATFTMEGGSITGNQAAAYGGIYVDHGGALNLKGGNISGNTTYSTQTRGRGIYVNSNAVLTLFNGSAITVTDSVYLPGGNIIRVSSTPADGSDILVALDHEPTIGNPVIIANSETDCAANFRVENQPANTEIVWENGQVKLITEGVKGWAALQAALNAGRTETTDGFIIQLGGDVGAEPDDQCLTFDYGNHPVILDLNGHTINRNLSAAAAADNGNVLTVYSGELTLRDSKGGGQITGGNNSGYGAGGVNLYGGIFTMEGGSITGNAKQGNNGHGGGVYMDGGTFNLKGGSITGNSTSEILGGGVYVNGGTFTVSGSPTVTGNDNGNSNIYLAQNYNISLGGELTEGASLGIGAGYEGTFAPDAQYEGVVETGFFTADSGYRLYKDSAGHPAIESENHNPGNPTWEWAMDFSAATLSVVCKNCGETIWSETGTVTIGYDAQAGKLQAVATATHDEQTYTETKDLTEYLIRHEAKEPAIDEDGTYTSGTQAYYELTAGDKKYYYTEVDGHPGEPCDPSTLKLDTFVFGATSQNNGIIEKYIGSFGTEKTEIDLPSRIENTVGQETDFVPLKILGDGVNAFYTRDISPSTLEDHVEITDRASITNVGAASFANRSDLTLNLNTTEAITIAGNAFGNSGNVTINALHVESPITIADGAFTNCENATIRTLHASGLQLGEHDDAKGRYTVEMQDGHSYNATAKWAADYSTADITISCSGCGDTHTFQATNITRTDTETVNPETQVKTYTISITAEGSYNGQTYSVTLNPVPYYEVTVQGTEGTLRLPRARNTDNTDFADYAMFTVTQDMLDPLHPPAGAVLDGLTDGSGTYHAGDQVTITRNTDFSASWRSTWAKVQTALNDSETNLVTVTLYSDIRPAAEGDSYLHIPSGKSVTLNLGNHTVNRGLSGATDNGYVIRVDGALTLSGNNGTVTGGNNTGDGGGIYVGNGGTLETNNVSITHNHAQNGGGVYMLNVSGAEFNNSSITDNTAAQQGGGLYIGGEASQSNGGILGIAPVAEMAVILNSTVVARNTAGMSAGGVYVNKGEMKIGSDTKIINNTKGGDFNNIDVGSGGVSILGGASGFLLGLPALTSAGITGLPVWAEILIAGGAVALGTVIFDRTKSGTDDDQERECDHPDGYKKSHLRWEESHYNYVEETQVCNKCGRILGRKNLTPEITENDSTKVTTYRVQPTYPPVGDTSRDVSPYKLIKQANIPEGIDTSKISSELGDKEELIAHKRHEEKTEQLGNSPWTFKTNEGLKFNDWLHGNEKVTSVTFSGNDDKETITVKVNWQLPYGYTPNDSEEDRVQGDHPLKPDSDENPIYVDKGTEKTVKENKWTRKAYSFSTWKQPSSVSIEKEGGEYKLVYSYDDEDKTKKADDEITIDLPVMLRAEWQSKWAALAANLEKDPHSVDMSENVEALSDDKTITVAAGNTDTLDLKGKTLDGKSQSGVEHIFDISGTLTVKDSTDEKNGVVKGGKTDKNGAGALVEKTGTLKLESGSIKDNMTVHQDNSDPGHGGGVYVDGDSDHHGSFEMSGGSVKDNKAWHSGGGVYITEHGSFKMSGGEITGNKAGHAESGSGSSGAKGGGVYVGGSFEVSGKVIIKDNKIGDTASNVYLPEGKTITVSGKLDNDARIHVSMQTPGVITSGLNAKGGDNARGKAENFVSDDENYKVIITDAGEAKLVDKDAKPKFNKARLELGGILRMRFYVELPEGWETENDRIDFSLKDMEPLSYAYSDCQTDYEGNYFVCPVNAYQMADTITAKYYHGDEEVATYTYTVEQYLRTLMYPSTNEQTAAINLAKATANYGHYIQPYLAATNGWTVGEDYAEMKTFEPIEYHGNPDVDESYKYVFNTTQNYSLKVAKTEFYLTLDSDTLLNVRVYLRNSEGTVTGKVGDKELKQWNRGGNSVVICLEGIPANALGTPYTFECFVDGVKVFDLSISALSIVNLALKNGGASDEERMAFTALYNYAMAAKVYTP